MMCMDCQQQISTGLKLVFDTNVSLYKLRTKKGNGVNTFSMLKTDLNIAPHGQQWS